jgi:flavodoxin
MKALIVYASWLGHNRAIAQTLATALARRGIAATSTTVARVAAEDVAGYDLLILGTFTHGGRASPRLRAFCESIPLRLFDRLAVAIFGTQMAESQQHGGPSGAGELEALLADRGVELALAPLVVGLPGTGAFRPSSSIGAHEQRRIEEFADALWEEIVPEPI